MRIQLQSNISELKISQDMDYINYSSNENLLNKIIGLSCLIIFFFCFEVLKIMYKLSTNTKIVFDGLFEYIKKTYIIAIFIAIPFIIFTSIYTYYIFGDYAAYYYKDFSFHFTKAATAIFRGMIDNKDYDNSLSRYSYTNIHKSQNSVSFKSLLISAEGGYLSILDVNGYFSYMVYAIIFYLVFKYIITGFYLSVYMNIYRRYYAKQMNEKYKIQLKA